MATLWHNLFSFWLIPVLLGLTFFLTAWDVSRKKRQETTDPKIAKSSPVSIAIIGLLLVLTGATPIFLSWESIGVYNARQAQNEAEAVQKRIAQLTTCDARADGNTAWVLAESEIKRRLKAPASASFGGYTFDNIGMEGCIFYITNHVDALNSFGAKIRNKYFVTLEKNPQTGSWGIKKVTMVQP